LSAEASAKTTAVSQGFNPVTPDIEIRTHAVHNGFRVTVRDRGVGVTTEDMPRVFDPYFTTKRTGSGLGLAIAKNIIEGMGGSVSLDSQPGVGTEIRIDLPLHIERHRAHPSTTRGGAA
jgi:signal transduction histidine kinase